MIAYLLALFSLSLLFAGPLFAADTFIVSLSNPHLENFSNSGAVGLYFSVTNERGQAVGQIGPENVEVEEDGNRTKLLDFRGEGQGRPVDIVVVFDITESMGPFIEGMKEATIDFADRLAKANRDYRLGLVTFEDYVMREELTFTRSAREFKSWIGSLRPSGGGDIPENSLDALAVASRFPFRPEAQAVVILITDAPNHFRGDGSEKANPYGREVTQTTADEVIAEMKKANLSVYAVAPPPFVAPDLRNIVEATAGRLYNIVSEGRHFPELISEIGRSIASQYFLTYTSLRPVEDGTRRKVVLQVKYGDGEGESSTSYSVRGVGGARLTQASPTSPLTSAGRVVYGWWNIAIPLLTCVGLILLSRVRLGPAASEFATPSSSPPLPLPLNRSPYSKLVRQSPLDELPHEYSLAREESLIGRGEECDIIIPHSSVSRQHARIKKLKPGYIIFDLQSRNGIYVNGRQTTENLLREGVTVRIGEVEFVFYEAAGKQ